MERDTCRKCSHCGQYGHNSRTCQGRGVKLFGVQLTVGLGRKNINPSSLPYCTNSHRSSTPEPSSTAEHSESGVAVDECVSDGMVQISSGLRERKKGVPWTEEEHRFFLLGLQKLGKGDWRGISRAFVTTRTPTQVASHAQKYFLRQNKLNKRKRRSSLFDIPAESIAGSIGIQKSVPKTPINFELSLGHNSSFTGTLGHGVTVGTLPVSSIVPVSLAPNNLSQTKSHLIQDNGRDPFLLQRSVSSSQYSVFGNSGVSASPTGSSSLPLALPPWPRLGNQNYLRLSNSCVLKPTATLPSPVTRIDESKEFSDLTLSIAPPSVERHSVFLTNSSSTGSLSSNRSEISVV